MIKNLKILKLKKIQNSLGDITKYISKKDKFYKKFGEIYFSDIKKNKEKGWNLHKKSTCFVTAACGEVLFTISDYKFKKKVRVNLNRKNPKILIIPPQMWFKFKSTAESSTIINFIDNAHDIKETEKKPLKSANKYKY